MGAEMSETATASAVPPLPPGYTLDKMPPLPPGYTLDQATPAGEYGYAAAPPETKPPAAAPKSYDTGNPMGDQGGTGGGDLPPGTPLTLLTPPISYGGAPVSWADLGLTSKPPTQPTAAEPIGNIIHAAYEGGANAPDASDWAPGKTPLGNPGWQLGKYIVNPLLAAGAGAGRALEQTLYEAGSTINPALGRDLAGLLEAFPGGFHDFGLPPSDPAYTVARRSVAADKAAAEAVPRNQFMYSDPPQPPQMSPSEVHAAIPPEPQPQQLSPLQPVPAPARGQPTHMYQGDEAVYPVTPTGNEQTLPDGRVYAEVHEPGHPPTWVRKDRVLPNQGEGAPVIQPPPQAVPPVEPPPPVPAIPAAPRNALAPDFVGPEETVAAPAPQPSSAGAAATPPAEAGLTPAQSAAAGSTADKQRLYRTRVPGEADNAEYIQGITPTRAQAEQTVNAARDSKLLRRISPEAEQNERNLLAEHTDIRKDEFQNIAGSDTTQQADLQAANDRIETQLQAAYAHGGMVDMQPVIDAVNAELSGSAGKLPPVRSAMQEILNAAQRADGSGLENTPLGANAVRRAIIYMQSNDGRNRNLGYGSRDAMAAMTRVKDALTRQIEPAAPGFTEANANYARARQAIDAREKLQEVEPKLYDSLGNMRYLAFHKMMGDIVAARDPRAPLGPYKALTEAQMNRLWGVHDDLRRAASAEDLAKANGSDTTQTLFDMARRAVKHSVGTAAGMGVGILASKVMGADVGVGAGMAAREMVNHLFDQRAVNKATAEHARMLRPDPALTTPNPYALPPSAP